MLHSVTCHDDVEIDDAPADAPRRDGFCDENVIFMRCLAAAILDFKVNECPDRLK